MTPYALASPPSTVDSPDALTPGPDSAARRAGAIGTRPVPPDTRRVPIDAHPVPIGTRSAPTDTEALGDEIARLSAHMHAAEYRMLTLLREFDEREGWAPGGFRSCAHWLSWRTGLSLGPAREKVRVARALAELPRIGRRMERGRFSYSKVRALTRVATAANEAGLIHFAEHATVAQVERLVRGWRRVDRVEARVERSRHEGRSLAIYPDEDGMYVVRGRLTPEVGGLLVKALELASRELYGADPDASPAQRSADALGEILRGAGGPSVQALLHVDPDGGARTEEGVRVSAETSRRLTCDAHVTELAQRNGAVEGDVPDVGRRSRTVPTRMRKALEARDEGRCRFPGCESRRCDAHHLRHWSRGGETTLENLVLLCRFHHRLVHEGGYRVEGLRGGSDRTRRVQRARGAHRTRAARLRFHGPDGREIPAHPRTGPVNEPALRRWHGQEGIDHEATLAPGLGGPVDYGWALDGLRRPEDPQSAA